MAKDSRKTRQFYLATNDHDAVCSLIPELRVGVNELDRAGAESMSRELAVHAGSGRVGRVRRQVARMLWDKWHDPYDDLPPWLGGEVSNGA